MLSLSYKYLLPEESSDRLGLRSLPSSNRNGSAEISDSGSDSDLRFRRPSSSMSLSTTSLWRWRVQSATGLVWRPKFANVCGLDLKRKKLKKKISNWNTFSKHFLNAFLEIWYVVASLKYFWLCDMLNRKRAKLIFLLSLRVALWSNISPVGINKSLLQTNNCEAFTSSIVVMRRFSDVGGRCFRGRRRCLRCPCNIDWMKTITKLGFVRLGLGQRKIWNEKKWLEKEFKVK